MRLSLLGNFKLEVGAYVIGETRISYFARVLFGILAAGLLGSAFSLVYNLSNSKLLVVQRKGSVAINMFYRTGSRNRSLEHMNNSNNEEESVRLIKTADDRDVLYLCMGYGTAIIVTILPVYFCTNDLVGIIMSLFFLSKVLASFLINYEHASKKDENKSDLYDFFVKYFVSISTGYDEYYINCFEQRTQKLENQASKLV